MSDLIKRHRAAAESWRHHDGNASAALCEFHDETANELERLTKLTEADGKEIGSYRAGTGLRGENQFYANRVAELEAALEESCTCGEFGHIERCPACKALAAKEKPFDC